MLQGARIDINRDDGCDAVGAATVRGKAKCKTRVSHVCVVLCIELTLTSHIHTHTIKHTVGEIEFSGRLDNADIKYIISMQIVRLASRHIAEHSFVFGSQ